jgi:hypothetical protein
MKMLLAVGQPGSGKSHFVKTQILNKVENLYIFDVYNYEYPQLEAVEPDKYKKGLAKYTGTDTDLLFKSIEKYRNTCFVCEDATIFLDNHKKTEEFKKVVYGRRHSNIFIVLLFHSLNRIPVWLMEQTNILVLLKTQDEFKRIEKKFSNPKIIKAFKFLEASKNKHEKVILEFF